ncbi:CHAP domain-containing protein [Hymenobacter weizhouensis]|uniref:CHAP domain-containing protein n=1 Tax=Hymenobacter sp. YIM 151500-1 TaxID=2987689 RepID=UPI002227AAD5|nr:CHAP domain-containing protein [Hymenobacter sp. YIM 151500-1]UYZ62620.1 CHAP domain-containing protein [Hymenobacter sp. YIM 151500-1]
MNTGAIKTLLSDSGRFEHSPDKPRVGDIALWEGHVGIVSAVGKGNTMKLVHASGKGKLSGENPYAISPAKYRSSTFYGYYRPIHETKNHVAGSPSSDQFITSKTRSVATKNQKGVYRSGADGTFPLQEVIVRPSSGQFPSEPVSLPSPVVPKLNVPVPQVSSTPTKLPTK